MCLCVYVWLCTPCWDSRQQGTESSRSCWDHNLTSHFRCLYQPFPSAPNFLAICLSKLELRKRNCRTIYSYFGILWWIHPTDAHNSLEQTYIYLPCLLWLCLISLSCQHRSDLLTDKRNFTYASRKALAARSPCVLLSLSVLKVTKLFLLKEIWELLSHSRQPTKFHLFCCGKLSFCFSCTIMRKTPIPPLSFYLKLQCNRDSHRSFLPFCDVHLRETDYHKIK